MPKRLALTRHYDMEQPPRSSSGPQLESPQPGPTMSLAGRMFNVFATPADVFSDIKGAKPNLWNWFAPALLLMIVAWVGAAVVFSQETIRHQLSEITSQAIEKQIERSHMPKEQAEQARAIGEKWGSIGTKISAYAAPVVGGVAVPLLWGLIIWLAGTKSLKGNFPFLKGVEVAGLSAMISVLDTVIRTLLILVTGNLFAAPGLALLIKDYDPQNPVHAVMGVVNIMTIWLLSVRSIGLARVAGASFAGAAAWVFGIWVSYTGLMLGFGFLMQRLFAR